ncbi:MAG: hypothetical protein LBS21_02845 [Clostridiales bacterium]|nr:hypothetical protein [Clostridiales bacterium]
MKLIKFAGFFLVFIMLIIQIGENHAAKLGSFSLPYHTFEINALNNRHSVSQITQKIASESVNCGVEVFYVQRTVFEKGEVGLTIYATTKAKNHLIKEYIWEGSYSSLFGEKRSINYKTFDELGHMPSVMTLRVIGSGSSAAAFERNMLINMPGRHINASVVKSSKQSENRHLFLVFLIVCAVNIVLSVYDVLLKRKESFVRITLGDGINRVVVLPVLADSAIYIVLSGAALSFFSIITLVGAYMPFLILTIVCVIAFNILTYFFAFRTGVKEIFSKVKISKGAVIAGYSIKAVVCLVAAVLTLYAMHSFSESYSASLERNYARQFSDYYHIDFSLQQGKVINPMDAFIKAGVMSDMFYREFYEEFNSYVLFNAFPARNIFLANLHAYDILEQRIPDLERIQQDSEFIILLPENYSENILDSVFFILDRELSFEPGSYDYETQVYTESVTLPSFGGLNNDFTVARNPVVVLMNFNPAEYGKAFAGEMMNMGGHSHFAYRVNDDLYRKFIMENGVISQYNIYTYNVLGKYEDNMRIKRNKTLIAAVNAVFLSLINFALTVLVTKMRYRANGIEAAVKKTLGYSLFQRNKLSLQIFLLLDLAISIVLFLITAILGYSFVYCALAALLFTLSDFAFNISFLSYQEKTGIIKILKGGAL